MVTKNQRKTTHKAGVIEILLDLICLHLQHHHIPMKHSLQIKKTLCAKNVGSYEKKYSHEMLWKRVLLISKHFLSIILVSSSESNYWLKFYRKIFWIWSKIYNLKIFKLSDFLQSILHKRRKTFLGCVEENFLIASLYHITLTILNR